MARSKRTSTMNLSDFLVGNLDENCRKFLTSCIEPQYHFLDVEKKKIIYYSVPGSDLRSESIQDLKQQIAKLSNFDVEFSTGEYETFYEPIYCFEVKLTYVCPDGSIGRKILNFSPSKGFTLTSLLSSLLT
jgi:hypothetical protein